MLVLRRKGVRFTRGGADFFGITVLAAGLFCSAVIFPRIPRPSGWGADGRGKSAAFIAGALFALPFAERIPVFIAVPRVFPVSRRAAGAVDSGAVFCPFRFRRA